jgi:hypothetical protein
MDISKNDLAVICTSRRETKWEVVEVEKRLTFKDWNGISFFLHKDPEGGEWIVTEKSTGLKIAGNSTRTGAVRASWRKIQVNTKSEVELLKAIAQQPKAPKYWEVPTKLNRHQRRYQKRKEKAL